MSKATSNQRGRVCGGYHYILNIEGPSLVIDRLIQLNRDSAQCTQYAMQITARNLVGCYHINMWSLLILAGDVEILCSLCGGGDYYSNDSTECPLSHPKLSRLPVGSRSMKRVCPHLYPLNAP